ncbi:hypothetical protein CSKR_200648 [Clonorchis sinensis]|uniref:Uncharacterized protein n=1 Tax=Clonorchis sinensis TaxID=79923 RepID=A0A8T1MGD4_CLOSI|nr:hypothetical protein CSKR_200648 [Clonorchis sinensis]
MPKFPTQCCKNEKATVSAEVSEMGTATGQRVKQLITVHALLVGLCGTQRCVAGGFGVTSVVYSVSQFDCFIYWALATGT